MLGTAREMVEELERHEGGVSVGICGCLEGKKRESVRCNGVMGRGKKPVLTRRMYLPLRLLKTE